MVLPPTFVKPDESTVIDYYVEVGAAAGPAPVIVQDAPTWTGVPLPAAVLGRIRERAPNVSHVKVENPPNQPKIAALTEAGFTCVGGYGALHLLEDRKAGICGVMSGAGAIREMAALWGVAEMDPDGAWPSFERLLPLLAFQMSSLDIFIAVQKYLLHRAGVISSVAVRRPGQCCRITTSSGWGGFSAGGRKANDDDVGLGAARLRPHGGRGGSSRRGGAR